MRKVIFSVLGLICAWIILGVGVLIAIEEKTNLKELHSMELIVIACFSYSTVVIIAGRWFSKSNEFIVGFIYACFALILPGLIARLAWPELEEGLKSIRSGN